MERLRQLRESKKLTQLRLSILLGVSQETISGYEIGKAIPPADMLVKLADTLDTSVDYLLERTEIKSSLRSAEFDEQETEVLSIFRKLNKERKDCVYEMLKGLDL